MLIGWCGFVLVVLVWLVVGLVLVVVCGGLVVLYLVWGFASVICEFVHCLWGLLVVGFGVVVLDSVGGIIWFSTLTCIVVWCWLLWLRFIMDMLLYLSVGWSRVWAVCGLLL